MLGVTVAVFTMIACGYLIIKDYKPQAVLIVGGFFMMFIAIIFDFGPILSVKKSTGFIWFDTFKFVGDLLETRTASLGILIMSVAGFARYMDKIGASDVLVHYSIKPLRLVKSPYVVMSMGFFIGQFMHMIIPSATGLGLVLMVTMYPIYVGLGVSRAAATAVVATNSCLDLGPASANSVLAAKTAGLQVVDYFINYQLPVGIAITLVVAVVHFFVQRWFDNKQDGTVEERIAQTKTSAASAGDGKTLPPGYYALLPVVPLTLIILFGYFKLDGITVDIVPAMFIGLTCGMLLELIRFKTVKKVFAGIQSFFDGMGAAFATVITLIVAGEIFAKGLISLGAIDTIINGAETMGFGKVITIAVMCVIISVSTIVMGSGNASFFSFAAFAPEIAKKIGFEAVNLLLPMQLSASVARAMSPISAVIVGISGIAQVSPFDVVKRTAIPMLVGLLLIQIVTFLVFS
jgi:C4-dicarboxylate transporter, DcuC family